MRACHEAFFKSIDSAYYRSVLALNGDIPDKEFFAANPFPVIAADGALNSLDALGVTPKAVVGDLDSAKPELFKDIEVVREPDQNSYDFEKALAYAGRHNLLPAVIVGISGGYLDHILSNVNIFLKNDCILYVPPIAGYLLKEGEVRSFNLQVNTKISLFGMPYAKVSSQGLKWELDEADLALVGDTSVSNRTTQDKISIEVHKGCLLVLIYLEKIEDCGSV